LLRFALVNCHRILLREFTNHPRAIAPGNLSVLARNRWIAYDNVVAWFASDRGGSFSNLKGIARERTSQELD
jgi:hypothetical protein